MKELEEFTKVRKQRALHLAWWGRQIKELMEIRNLTEEDLAKATGMKQSNIHKLIKGKYNPSFNAMENVIRKLGYVITIQLPF